VCTDTRLRYRIEEALTNHVPTNSQETKTGSPDFVRDSLIFVRLVVSHVSVAKKGPLDEDGHGAPAEQNDGQLQQIALAPEVGPPLLFHELPLGEDEHRDTEWEYSTEWLGAHNGQ